MAGSSQASNLTGMLGNLADSVGRMAEPGNQYVDTFRRLQAPEADMNDSASLLRYADWARRNGYDDEAKQYMVLGATQKKAEEQKSYKTSVATGTEKLRKNKAAVARVDAEIKRQEEAGVVNPATLEARDRLVSAYSQTADQLNAMGKASNYGVGNEGAEAVRAINAYEYEQEQQALQMANLRSTALENFQDQLDRGAEAQVNPNMYSDPAQQRTYEKAYRTYEQTVSEMFGKGTEEYKAQMIRFNENRTLAAKTQNEKYWTKVEAQAVKLGEYGVNKLLEDLNREEGPATTFGGKFKRFFNNLLTDQADVVDWSSNPDNQLLIQKAIERVASTAPYSVPDWESKTPSEKLDIITKDVIANLEQNPAFKEELAEDQIGLIQDLQSIEDAARIKDLDEGTMPGTEVGDQYQVYLQGLDQQYIDAGYPGGVQEVRETNPEEWKRIQEKWRELLGRTEGVNMTNTAMVIGDYPRK
jgi:hypothetical protein